LGHVAAGIFFQLYDAHSGDEPVLMASTGKKKICVAVCEHKMIANIGFSLNHAGG